MILKESWLSHSRLTSINFYNVLGTRISQMSEFHEFQKIFVSFANSLNTALTCQGKCAPHASAGELHKF